MKNFLVLLFFLIHCSQGINYNKNQKLATPAGFNVYPLPGSSFKVSYFVQNSEDIFDGYNLYITRESTGEVVTTAPLQPYTINGALPTFIHSAADFNPTSPVEITLTLYMDTRLDLSGNISTNYIPFEPGVYYFFKIKAHSIYDTYSTFSNEVSVMAIN